MREEEQRVTKTIDFEQVMKKTCMKSIQKTCMKSIQKTKDYKTSKPK